MLASKWTKRVTAVAVVIFALWFRLAYQATTIVDVPMRADAGQYVRIASNIVKHGMISMAYPDAADPTPDSYRGPGYPALVAFTMLLGGDEKWYHYLLKIQAVLGALSVALTMLIARRWLAFPYAIGAGLLVAVWPHMVTLSGYILTETLFGFTVLLSTYLLCRAASSRRGYWYALAGFSFACAALINPAILPFPVLIGAFLLFSKRKYALLFLVCTVIFPLAWGMRGLLLDAEKSSSGRLMENVLAGMEPDFSYVDTPAALAARARVLEGLDRYRENQIGELQVILGRLAQQPGYYLKWYVLQKPMRFWQWSMLNKDADIYVYPVLISPFQTQPFFRAIVSICAALNVFLVSAAFAGVLVIASRAVRRQLQDKDRPLLLVTLLFVYTTVLHAVLTPDPRYATPFRPFEILLALSFLAMLHTYWQESKAERQVQVV